MTAADEVNDSGRDADEIWMLTVDAAPYTGPTPSPSRAWSPWVIVTSAITAAFSATQCALNFVERHYQQQRKSLHPPSATQIRHTLHLLHTVGNLTLASAVVFTIVGIVWSAKRRPRARLQRDGESSVEVSMRRVFPVAYFLFWGALAVGVALSMMAKSVVHSGMSIDDFVRYRTLLVFSAAARTVMWLCWVPLVVEANSVQARREANAPRPAPSLQVVNGPRPS